MPLCHDYPLAGRSGWSLPAHLGVQSRVQLCRFLGGWRRRRGGSHRLLEFIEVLLTEGYNARESDNAITAISSAG